MTTLTWEDEEEKEWEFFSPLFPLYYRKKKSNLA